MQKLYMLLSRLRSKQKWIQASSKQNQSIPDQDQDLVQNQPENPDPVDLNLVIVGEDVPGPSTGGEQGQDLGLEDDEQVPGINMAGSNDRVRRNPPPDQGLELGQGQDQGDMEKEGVVGTMIDDPDEDDLQIKPSR